MNSEVFHEGLRISDNTVMPVLPELFIDKRQDDFLILNPLGPRWFIGSKFHLDFMKLCDGKRSLRDIYDLLLPCREELSIGELSQLAETLLQIGFYAPGVNQPVHQCGIVHFYVTRRCNLECPFCFNDSTSSKCNNQHKELPAEDWINLAYKIAAINPNASISISGGEPLLRKDIVEIIDGVCRNNLEIRLITNGTLINDALTKYFSKIPKFKVQVSIDSLLPEENDRTRGQGNLEKALASVHRMIDAGIVVGITSTVTQINKNSTWRMREFCEKHNIDFGTSFFFSAGKRSHSNADWLELKSGEILESARINANHFQVNSSDNIIPKYGLRRSHCGIGCGQLSIHPDGFVSPCRLLLDPSFYIGNVMETELVRLLEIGRQKFDFIGVDTMTCGCAECPVRYLCVGGCKAISFYRNGKLDSLPPNCDLLRKTHIESLWASVF